MHANSDSEIRRKDPIRVHSRPFAVKNPITRRDALKDFSYVAGLSLFLPRLLAQEIVPKRRKSAAGSANSFYYSSAGATPPTLESFWFSADQFVGNSVTATVGGSLTKIGHYGENGEAAINNLRISLWKLVTATWTFHECGIIALPASNPLGWSDFTLLTPYTVAAAEVVRIMYVSEDAGGNVSWYKGADTGGFRDTRTYANGCLTTVPAFADNTAAGARIFVA